MKNEKEIMKYVCICGNDDDNRFSYVTLKPTFKKPKIKCEDCGHIVRG